MSLCYAFGRTRDSIEWYRTRDFLDISSATGPPLPQCQQGHDSTQLDSKSFTLIPFMFPCRTSASALAGCEMLVRLSEAFSIKSAALASRSTSEPPGACGRSIGEVCVEYNVGDVGNED